MRDMLERAQWFSDTAVSVSLEVLGEVYRLESEGQISKASRDYIRDMLQRFISAAVAVRVAISLMEYKWHLEKQDAGPVDDFKKYG